MSKTADKIFEMLEAIMERIGEENVMQVINVNAANYKVTGQLLMKKRKKNVLDTICYPLYRLDIGRFSKNKLEVLQVTISKGRIITSYIYSRTILISILRHFTKEKDLIKLTTTRFVTTYLNLGCLNDYKI
jgi:hypothetical protein